MEKEFNKKFLSLKPILNIIILVSLIFLFSLLSCGTNQNKTSLDFPNPYGYINDYTNTLSENWINQTEQLVQNVEKETSCEIAVAVINDLEGSSIEEYAVSLFDKWGIGKKDKDNGVLLLMALKDRKLRIEVGYGLEGVITDLQAKVIIDDVIVPRFSSNKYESGIYNGIVAIANIIYIDQGIEQIAYTDNIAPEPKKSFEQSPWFIVIILMSVILPWILIGTIFGSFRLKCYIKEHRCPKCKKIGLVIKQKILVSPTYYKYSGRLEVEKYCKYCDFKEKSTRTISRLNKSSSSGSSSSDFSSSSSSSSSGSSSSSSSFGGGSSGGGGASGSW